MIQVEITKVKISSRNLKYYEDIYNIKLKVNTILNVNIKDLPKNSRQLISVKCDSCGIEKEIKYCDYLRNDKPFGEYHCILCKGESIKNGWMSIS